MNLNTNPNKKRGQRTNIIRVGVYNNLNLLQFAGNSIKMQLHPVFSRQMVSLNEVQYGSVMEFIDLVSPEFPVILMRYDSVAQFRAEHQNLIAKVITGIPGEPTHTNLKSYPNCVNMKKKTDIYAKIYEMVENRTFSVSKYSVGLLNSEIELTRLMKLFSEKFDAIQPNCFFLPFFGGKVVQLAR